MSQCQYIKKEKFKIEKMKIIIVEESLFKTKEKLWDNKKNVGIRLVIATRLGGLNQIKEPQHHDVKWNKLEWTIDHRRRSADGKRLQRGNVWKIWIDAK